MRNPKSIVQFIFINGGKVSVPTSFDLVELDREFRNATKDGRDVRLPQDDDRAGEASYIPTKNCVIYSIRAFREAEVDPSSRKEQFDALGRPLNQAEETQQAQEDKAKPELDKEASNVGLILAK